jgi:hypothetical protein
MHTSSILRLRLPLLACLLMLQGCQFALSLWVMTGSTLGTSCSAYPITAMVVRP